MKKGIEKKRQKREKMEVDVGTMLFFSFSFCREGKYKGGKQGMKRGIREKRQGKMGKKR